jgi:hypothetical protein
MIDLKSQQEREIPPLLQQYWNNNAGRSWRAKLNRENSYVDSRGSLGKTLGKKIKKGIKRLKTMQ